MATYKPFLLWGWALLLLYGLIGPSAFVGLLVWSLVLWLVCATGDKRPRWPFGRR